MTRTLALTAVLLTVLSHPGLAAPSPSARAKEFLFPSDLGPAEIDVSSYPAVQRDRYRLVVKDCSSCHTLARTVNAPQATREQWAPFVDRMHFQAGDAPTAFSPKEAAQVLSFLVFDSRERKIKHKARFDADAAALKKRFDEVRRSLGGPPEAKP